MIMQLGATIAMNFTKSVPALIVLQFIFGAACVGTRAIDFLYLMDLLPKAWQVPVGSVLNFIDTSLPAIGVVYFWKISKEWTWWAITFCEVGSLLVIVGLFFIPESPKYLLCKKRYDEARAAVNFF
jgi:SP family sugar:H+ symporter-like MFS transporter